MNFGVVLVTYNRLDKLKIALKCYEKQTYLPKEIIVVNNNSNDGTYEYLEKWKLKESKIKKTIINLKKNSGGSGGFYTGLKESLSKKFDYVWVSDDDAFPEKDCFEIANNFIEEHKDKNISSICGTVLNRGNIDLFHRRRLYKCLFFLVQTLISKKEYEKEYFKLNLFTYVGTFINSKKLKEVGLTKKDYFIYCDDTEHSYRLSLVGDIYCVPKIKIIHDGPIVNSNEGITWKLFYGIRNSIDFVKNNFSSIYYNSYKLYFRIKYYLLTLILWKNKKEGFKLINSAIKAAKENKTGIDSKYKPGWKPGI